MLPSLLVWVCRIHLVCISPSPPKYKQTDALRIDESNCRKWMWAQICKHGFVIKCLILRTIHQLIHFFRVYFVVWTPGVELSWEWAVLGRSLLGRSLRDSYVVTGHQTVLIVGVKLPPQRCRIQPVERDRKCRYHLLLIQPISFWI